MTPTPISFGATNVGTYIQNVDVWVTMRGGAAAVGDVLQFDYHQADAATTTVTNAGAATSIFANVAAPTAASVAFPFPVGVALEAIADDATGQIRVQGICDAYVIAAAGSVAIGDPLVVTTAMNFDLVSAAGEYFWAIATEAQTTPTTRTLSQVYLPGGHLGQDVGT